MAWRQDAEAVVYNVQRRRSAGTHPGLWSRVQYHTAARHLGEGVGCDRCGSGDSI